MAVSIATENATTVQPEGHLRRGCVTMPPANAVHPGTQRPEGDRSLGGVRATRVTKRTAAQSVVDARAGQLGVMLFFCLSGLLMAELYLRQDATWASVWNFVRARFAGIFPLFATFVVGSALIYHFDTRFPFQLDAVAATKHLLLFGDGLTNVVY